MSSGISVRGLTHQRLQTYCDDRGLRYGPTVQKWIEEDLDAKGVPVPTSVTKKPTPPKKPATESEEDPEEIPDQNTTF